MSNDFFCTITQNRDWRIKLYYKNLDTQQNQTKAKEGKVNDWRKKQKKNTNR